MITVADVREAVKEVLGTCSDEVFYSKLNEAVEELANLGNWDPMVVYLDICTRGCEITLPDDIEVPLAVNVGGFPADFRNKWFEFHLNGPGSECCPDSCSFAWQDKGNFPTFRDPIRPSYVAAYPEVAEDPSAHARIYGYDEHDKWIMTPDCNGVLQDGFDVPIIFGTFTGMTTNQRVKRITRVTKTVTNGFVKLVALDPGNHSGGTLLGVFRPNETQPEFRRITVSGNGTDRFGDCTSCLTWVRMRARRKVFKLSQPSDLIPLNSVTAIKMMVMAIRKYEADLAQEYAVYFSAARDALQREQKSRSGPNQIKIQFQGSYAAGRCDNMV